MRIPSAVLLLLILSPALAGAAEPLSMGSALLQTTWALLVVIGLILALYGLAKKRLFLGKISGSAIKIVELRPLMQKSTLALVEVHNKQYLLGISNAGIHFLAEVSAETPKKQQDFESLLAEHQ